MPDLRKGMWTHFFVNIFPQNLWRLLSVNLLFKVFLLSLCSKQPLSDCTIVYCIVTALLSSKCITHVQVTQRPVKAIKAFNSSKDLQSYIYSIFFCLKLTSIHVNAYWWRNVFLGLRGLVIWFSLFVLFTTRNRQSAFTQQQSNLFKTPILRTLGKLIY